MLKPGQARVWRVAQGSSAATVRAPTYDEAKARAAAIGFNDPDSIVLVQERREDVALPLHCVDNDIPY